MLSKKGDEILVGEYAKSHILAVLNCTVLNF